MSDETRPIPKETHVAVLKGGWSAEREVSLVSGEAYAKACRDLGYKVTEVDVDRAIASVLAELKPDIALNALHGQWGEDGCVQGLLEVSALQVELAALVVDDRIVRVELDRSCKAGPG